MSSLTKKILEGIVTMNPLISPVGCCRGYGGEIVEMGGKGKEADRNTDSGSSMAANVISV